MTGRPGKAAKTHKGKNENYDENVFVSYVF